MVEWRTIPGFSDYEASNDGDVRRRTASKRGHKVGHFLAKHRNDHGYLRVSIQGDFGKRRHICVHVLVMFTFGDPAPSLDHRVAHVNGKQDDCSIGNLEWKLPIENEADKKRHGTAPRFVHMVPVPLKTRDEIKKRIARGESRSRIAKDLGIHRKTVARIAKKKAV